MASAAGGSGGALAGWSSVHPSVRPAVHPHSSWGARLSPRAQRSGRSEKAPRWARVTWVLSAKELLVFTSKGSRASPPSVQKGLVQVNQLYFFPFTAIAEAGIPCCCPLGFPGYHRNVPFYFPHPLLSSNSLSCGSFSHGNC